MVDKPRGPTSHDVVAAARKELGVRAVGHAGTLDPMATGVLLLLVGQARKLSAYLTAEEKRYRATVAFGRSTTTDDAEGDTVREVALAEGWLARADLDGALAAELARTEQSPPTFSAIKVDGQAAHRRRRRGEEVELPSRPVEVRSLTVIESSDEAVCVDLTVSKGYFVRAFARDLGERLGRPAHLSALRRLASGSFRLEDACAWPPREPISMLSVEEAARRALPGSTLTERGAARARLGQKLGDDDFETGTPASDAIAAWFDPSGSLVALGERRADGVFAVVRGFSASAPR